MVHPERPTTARTGIATVNSEKNRATLTEDTPKRDAACLLILTCWFVVALLATLLLTACTIAREGSTIVRIIGAATNGAPVTVNAAANGATAQAADNGASPHATSRGALAVASRWWLWVVVGIVIIIAVWLVWKFVFTGAHIALHWP